jgi:hypothetical protein
MATFATMQANIGNNVMDTSSGTASIIGTYINRRYYQILRQINWSYINEDYTVTTVAGTADYALASDFGKELYCRDNTNGHNISKVDLEGLSRQYATDLNTQGTVYRYAIFNSDDGSKYIRFHYTPNSIIVVDLPYIIKPTALSGTTSPVIDISDLIEIGATADTLRYKRKWQQAREMETQFRIALDDYIWYEYNQPNKVYQFKPNTFNRDDLV